MGKSIIMSELTSDGYQELYPKTLGSQIEGTVAEASHSLSADSATIANIANLNWITLFENTLNIPIVNNSASYTPIIAENSFSVKPLLTCHLIEIIYTISNLSVYCSSWNDQYITLELPFLNSISEIHSHSYDWESYSVFSIGYCGKMSSLCGSGKGDDSNGYYTLGFGGRKINNASQGGNLSEAEIFANANTFVNLVSSGSIKTIYEDIRTSAFNVKLSIRYVPN